VPLIPLLAALLLVLFFVLAAPFLLIVRYRVGIARRPARRWIATINLLSLLASAALFVWAAAVTNFWVPHAFRYSLIGLISGALLGLLGLILTRWEPTPRMLYYKPNRWLVLVITFAVAARMLYGLWRIWHAWRTSGPDASWLAAAGIPGSMAVGALVIGYYLSYFAGIVWRIRSFQRSRIHFSQWAKLLILAGSLALVGCNLESDFPLEERVKTRLHPGITVDEVRTIFGEPTTTSHDDSGVARMFYVSSVGARTVKKEGYVGFEVKVIDGKVASWRILSGYPSYGRTTLPRELKWQGYLYIAFFVGAMSYAVFRVFLRTLSEDQLIRNAYQERSIPRLPAEFRFINHDTTLQEVFDKVGPPTRERKFALSEHIGCGGYGYTEGPLGLPAITLVEYDLPYHALVALIPEYPFKPENRIRAVFYRRPLPDEEL
jgi:hypothetical protein